MTRARILTVIGLCVLFIFGILGFGFLTSDHRNELTIASGPVNGPSWQVAEQMGEPLEEIGYQVKIVPQDETLTLIDQVDNPDDMVDIAFLYTRIDPRRYPLVNSLGTVGRRPIIFAAIGEDSTIRSIPDMKGARIAVGPAQSATAELAMGILEQYGVTAENSTFIQMPSSATLADYIDAGVDVAAFRYGDASSLVTELFLSKDLRPIPIPENLAVAGRLPSAQAMTIPRGGLSLDPVAPATEFPTVGQLLTVVARSDLNRAAAYAIAETLTQELGDSTLFSSAGEFPDYLDRQLPINPAAADFYRSGQVPWQYENLPPILADSLFKLIIPLSLLILLSSLYSMFLPEAYSLWHGVIKPRSEERQLAAMEERLSRGEELTLRQRQRLSRILGQQDAGRAMRQRAEAMRGELSEPVHLQSDAGGEPGRED